MYKYVYICLYRNALYRQGLVDSFSVCANAPCRRVYVYIHMYIYRFIYTHICTCDMYVYVCTYVDFHIYVYFHMFICVKTMHSNEARLS